MVVWIISDEQFKAFLERVKGDNSLQEKLKAATDVDAVLATTKKAGFSISADDLKNAQSELSEDELENVVWAGRSVGEPTKACCNNTDDPQGKTHSCWNTRCC